MGGKNTEKYMDTRMHILNCLGKDWIRSKEWENSTGKDPGTFHKHVKDLVLDGLVEKRKESRRMVYYRRTDLGYQELHAYRVLGLIEQGSFDSFGPDKAKLYSDFDLSVLNQEEQKKVDEFLHDLYHVFTKLDGFIWDAWFRKMLQKRNLRTGEDLDFWLNDVNLYTSMDMRWETSKGVQGFSEENILNAEGQYLGKYKLTRSKLFDNKYMWARMNRVFREVPLCNEDLLLLNEMRRAQSKSESLDRVVDELMISGPSVLVTLFDRLSTI